MKIDTHSIWLAAGMLTLSALPASAMTELKGEIRVKNPEVLVYNPAEYEYPALEIEFLEPGFESLRRGQDYYLYVWVDYDGIALIDVYGCNEYDGHLSTTCQVIPGEILPSYYSLRIPEDCTYDDYSHEVSLSNYSVVSFKVHYITSDVEFPDGNNPEDNWWICEEIEDGIWDFQYPLYPGTYEVSITAEGTKLFNPYDSGKVGEIKVYPVDLDQIALIEEIGETLQKNGFKGFSWSPYRFPTCASRYSQYLGFSKGKISEIKLNDAYDSDGEHPFPIELLRIPALKRIELARNSISASSADLKQAIASNPDYSVGAASIRYLYAQDNSLSGDIAEFAYLFPQLEELVISDNCFSSISSPLSEKIDYIYYDRQLTDLSTTVDFSNLNLAQLTRDLPAIALYDPYSGNFNSGNLTLILSDTDQLDRGTYFALGIQLAYDWDGSLSAPYIYNAGYLPYKGKMHDKLRLSAGTYFTGHYGTWMDADVTFIPLDTNFDFNVSVADLQRMANYILSPNYSSGAFNFTAADLNTDESVDARDLVLMINTLLGFAPRQSAKSPIRNKVNNEKATQSSRITIENGELWIDSEHEIGAIDIVVDSATSPEWSELLREAGLAVAVRDYGTSHRLLAYSPSGASLAAGRNLIASGVDGNLSAASIATVDGFEIPVKFDVTTSVENVSTAEISASVKANEIHLFSPSKADWQLVSMAGITLGEGSLTEGQHILPVSKPDSSPVILIVTTENGTKTFKF